MNYSFICKISRCYRTASHWTLVLLPLCCFPHNYLEIPLLLFFFLLLLLLLLLVLPGWGEWKGRDFTVDAVTVALEEGAQVWEGAFFQVDTVRPVPCHYLPVERREGVNSSETKKSKNIIRCKQNFPVPAIHLKSYLEYCLNPNMDSNWSRLGMFFISCHFITSYLRAPFLKFLSFKKKSCMSPLK